MDCFASLAMTVSPASLLPMTRKSRSEIANLCLYTAGCLKCEAVRPSLRGAEATKQSTLSLRGKMDCFVASAPRNDDARGLSQSAPPQLKRREHGLGDIGGAITAAEFHRLDAVGIDLVDRAFDALA